MINYNEDHNITITSHARERIKQRLGTRDDKLQRLAWKAWRSIEINNRKLDKAEYKNNEFECRFLMGYVFVFRKSKEYKLLITVY